MKNYWFALKSHIYVEFKTKFTLLYDTVSGERIESELEEGNALIRQMYEPLNLGVVSVNETMFTHSPLKEWIEEILKRNMGDLTDEADLAQKPVRLIPILNLQKDIDKFKENENSLLFFEKDVSKYLLELNIYVNDVCDKACPHCDLLCKQTHCCTATQTYHTELSLQHLQTVFQQLQYWPIHTINILGGDVLHYSQLEQLEELACQYMKELHYYLHYKNYQLHSPLETQKIELIVTFPIDEMQFEKVYTSIHLENTRFHFLIEDEAQYIQAEKLIEGLKIEAFDLTPIFTGANMSFFEENVYVDKDDIFFKIFQIREIFRNKKLNSNFFGMLHLLPHGEIKANMNTRTIGNIKEDELVDIIQKELIQNTAWRKIRDSHPCNECIYQFICASPSNYEEIIGRNNLCHIDI